MFNKSAVSMRELELQSAQLLPGRETLQVMRWWHTGHCGDGYGGGYGGGWGHGGGYGGGYGGGWGQDGGWGHGDGCGGGSGYGWGHGYSYDWDDCGY